MTNANLLRGCDQTRLAGGGGRNRTDDPLRARQVLSQLSYAPSLQPDLVGLDRLELSTSRLSGVRSNHLSYRPPQTAAFLLAAASGSFFAPVTYVLIRSLRKKLRLPCRNQKSRPLRHPRIPAPPAPSGRSPCVSCQRTLKNLLPPEPAGERLVFVVRQGRRFFCDGSGLFSP